MARKNCCSRCSSDPCKCHQDPCCPPDPCMRVKSSEVTYDGGDIRDLGIKNGMNLNDVIARITSSLTNIYSDTRVLKVANFKGITDIIIKDADTVEMVFYCGNKVPTSLYKLSGSYVVLDNKQTDFDDSSAEVTVLYRGKASI